MKPALSSKFWVKDEREKWDEGDELTWLIWLNQTDQKKTRRFLGVTLGSSIEKLKTF